MPLTDLQNRIKKLIDIDFEVAIQNAIIEGESVMIEMLKSQIASGITGDNTAVTLYGIPSYAESTIRYKKSFIKVGLGAVTDHITNYMFGDFYNNMTLQLRSGNASIISNVPYFDKIIERSGPSLMKLTPENYESFYQLFIEPALLKEIEKFNEP